MAYGGFGPLRLRFTENGCFSEHFIIFHSPLMKERGKRCVFGIRRAIV